MTTICCGKPVRKRVLIFFVLLLAIPVFPPQAAGREAPVPSANSELQPEASLNDMLAFAAQNNPDVRAAFARWQAATARIPQARSLPDPMVGFGVMIESFRTRQVFRVEQSFPWFGTLGLRGGVAAEAARAEAHRLEAASLRVRFEVMDAYAEYAFIGAARGLVRRNLELVQQLEEVALRQYQAAEVSQADVLRLQIEADTLEKELRSLADRERPAQARLNAALGRQSVETLPPPGPVPHNSLPASASETPAAAAAANPQLLAAHREILRAELGARLARRENLPNFFVGVEYKDGWSDMWRDEVGVMVGLSIPLWWEKNRGRIREAEADLTAAQSDWESLRNQLESQIELALFEVRDADRDIELFSVELLPKARQTFDVIQTGYQAGEQGFLDLIDAQRALLNFELSLIRAKTNRFQRIAAWERLAGLRPEAGSFGQRATPPPAAPPQP